MRKTTHTNVMWRWTLALLALMRVAHAGSACRPAESSEGDLRRATEMVQRLPELAGWAQSSSVVFDTGSRQKIGNRCYEAVFVYRTNAAKDLDLRYVFAVHLPTRTILVEDIPNAEFNSLKKWRANNARFSKP